MRTALYWAPKPSSRLERAAREWLQGKDDVLPTFCAEERRQILAAPKHYGFHATIKPPFRLRSQYYLQDLENEVAAFAQEERNRPFEGSSLEVAEMGGFFCLQPVKRSLALQRFAARTVRHFDHFREPADELEIKRRRAGGLTDRQDQLLLEWGYPYVLDEFIFHLTLTGKIQNPSNREVIRQELVDRFRRAIRQPLQIDSLSLFIQHGSYPFFEYRRWELGEQLLSARSIA